MKSTSIPVSGDREFVQVVKTLAAAKGTTVADLVRQALDTAYGAELARIRSIFFGEGDVSKHQQGTKASEGTAVRGEKHE